MKKKKESDPSKPTCIGHVSNAAAVHPEQVVEPSMSGLRTVAAVPFVVALAPLALAWIAEWRHKK